MEKKTYRIAILTKEYTDRLRDVGDINAVGLFKNLPHEYTADLVYLKNSSSRKSKNVISFWKAFFRNYDAVYASSPKRYYAILCLVFAFAKLNPLYISIFDSSLTPITSSPIGKKVFTMLVARGMLVPFSVSRYQRKYFKKKIGIETQILYPCLTTFGKKNAKRRLPRVVLFAGSTNNEKRGLDTLLRAAKTLVKEYPRLQIRVLNKFSNKQRAGMKEAEHAKKLGLEKNVKLVGYVASMTNEYKKAWVYVLPFKRTKFIPPIPFTIIEALSFEVPAISTDLPHLAELLPKDSLVPTDDPKALADAIRKHLNSKRVSPLSKDFHPKTVAKKFTRLVVSKP